MAERYVESALVLLVPDVERSVAPWRERHDPRAADGIPAHVTVLYPWLPPADIGPADLDALAVIAAGQEPLELVFNRVGRFHRGLWLAPDPAAPVLRLTEAVTARWPDYPPYGGAYIDDPDDIGPHLTLALGQGPEELQALADEVTTRLPLTARVDRLDLVVGDADGQWFMRESFPFGADAATKPAP
ncbi:2'-5' RNA ligase family protein [Embleya sp. NBC_00896]|uniref:2'-5' RNA ligase family protein n=1 Tax=Embleya sp. NBC_00896 TaxID=2975961 RepID=UPI002F908E7A|nr:2'-5' RNA ligase family protein [Embleya sp. NBC_00896]